MAAGTPTLSDSYWLGQSTIFQHRVQEAIQIVCEQIANEAITTLGGVMPSFEHALRVGFAKTLTNPSTAGSWLAQITMAVAVDATVIGAATVAATNYTPITTTAGGDTAAAEGGAITTAMIENAFSAAYNTFVPGL